jgi:GNAT superfamily N-acetyltransferase
MNVPPCTLRRATRVHANALLLLICALAEFENLEPPDAEAQQRLLEDSFGAQPRIEPWLAFVEGRAEPVGYAILLETYSSFLARPTLYLEDIFVLPEFRRRGIGNNFLRHCVALAHERGCGRMEWTCLDWNTRAQRVYEDRLGAQRMSEWYLYRLTRPAMENYLSGRRNCETPSSIHAPADRIASSSSQRA